MEYAKALILGLVQGLTEFLPISSSVHLMLLEELGIGQKSLIFNIMLHVATLLSVCVIYRKKLWECVKHPLSKEVRHIVIATLPTAAIAFFVRLTFDKIGLKLLPFGFMITTAMLVLGSLKWEQNKKMDNVSAFITGIAQGIATIGGVSRSGSTVSAQIMLGIDKKEAGDFSFMLSIPIIIGSAVAEAIAFDGFGKVSAAPLLIAMAAAFLSGLLAIKTFLRILATKSLFPFAAYTFLISIAAFVIIYG
jgi:undecaprenyl-diphosphatase